MASFVSHHDPVPTENSQPSPYEIRIKADRPWFAIDWHDLLHYQDLLWLMVRRDFVSKYKQTVLGPAWMIVQPLATTLIFTVIFSRVAQISTDGAPAPLFYLSGLLGWNLFTWILSSTGNVLQSNLGLFGKVYFPRLIVPLANTLSALIPFGIQLITFLVMLTVYAYGDQLPATPDSGIVIRGLLFIAGVSQVILAGLGCGLLFSALTAVYRDLHHFLTFLIQVWMYLTPVIYPLSKFPEKWRWVAQLNPVTTPIESIRFALIGTGSVTLTGILLSWTIILLVLILGFAAFNHTEKDYVDKA